MMSASESRSRGSFRWTVRALGLNVIARSGLRHVSAAKANAVRPNPEATQMMSISLRLKARRHSASALLSEGERLRRTSSAGVDLHGRPGGYASGLARLPACAVEDLEDGVQNVTL